MSKRGEEFVSCLGNDKPGHEFYDDVEFEEVEINNIIDKGGLNENGKQN